MADLIKDLLLLLLILIHFQVPAEHVGGWRLELLTSGILEHEYWKKMVDKQSDDIYYKDYRRELYLDIYLVSLRYKKPKATWGWLDY